MIVCRGIVGGNGFGNEFLYVAKALTASLDLGLPFWKPRWLPAYAGLPEEIHERRFLTHRLRYLAYKASHRFIAFGAEEYAATGEVAISKALLRYLQKRGIGLHENYVVTFPGFYPDISSVAHRIDYLRSLLMRDVGIAKEVFANLDAFCPGKLRVGVHIRKGDFSPCLPLGTRWPEGQWNIRISLEWYHEVCRLLQEAFPGEIEFFLSSNADDTEIEEFRRRFTCHRGKKADIRSASDVVDLLTLSYCDLHVASVSWFGFWAMAFSQRPFIWYEYAHRPQFRRPPNASDPGAFFVGIPAMLPNRLLCNLSGVLAVRRENPSLIGCSGRTMIESANPTRTERENQ